MTEDYKYDQYKLLVELESRASDSFAKALLTLSSGGIIAFVTYLSQPDVDLNSDGHCSAIWTAIFFVAAICSSLLALLFSMHSMREQRELNQNDRTDVINRWTLPTVIADWCAFLFVLLGIILFLVTAIVSSK